MGNSKLESVIPMAAVPNSNHWVSAPRKLKNETKVFTKMYA